MNESPRTDNDTRQQLRQQWLQQAAAAFDLYFDGQQTPPLVTFTQREGRACSLTQELAAWLLEQDLADDPAVRPDDAQPIPCPRCSRPARRQTPPGQPLPRRQLTCAAGEVTLCREQWYCKTCRVSFFPSGSATPVGNGGL
jgi:hypothetical protein